MPGAPKRSDPANSPQVEGEFDEKIPRSRTQICLSVPSNLDLLQALESFLAYCLLVPFTANVDSCISFRSLAVYHWQYGQIVGEGSSMIEWLNLSTFLKEYKHPPDINGAMANQNLKLAKQHEVVE